MLKGKLVSPSSLTPVVGEVVYLPCKPAREDYVYHDGISYYVHGCVVVSVHQDDPGVDVYLKVTEA